MAFPQSFMDELTARNELVDVVSGYVNLQRKSGRYWGCCPFHNEKTPSFSIMPDGRHYYCFGCHKGGDVITFIMEEENLGFRDAVQFLADRSGLQVPEEERRGDGQGYKRRERLLSLNKEAARYFHTMLGRPEGAEMLRYLQERRLSKKTITSFGLGAAPVGWDNLIRAMGEKGYDKGELLECGLAVKSDQGRIYDRFRNRVMFPIIDIRGNVIGFGGRVLDDSKPKYLNSPDSPVYNKSKNLFALNIVKKSKSDRIILTEGYMDTIALHQAGFDYAVASLGTALTEDHAKLIAHYAKEVIISYDGDEAGVNAAKRAIGIFEKTGLNVRVLQVRGAKDPDEFVKKYGPEAFEKLLNESGNQIEYRLQQLAKNIDLNADDQKVQYVQQAVQVIAAIPSPVEREVYSNRVASQVKLTPTAVLQEVERARKKRSWKERRQEERTVNNPTAAVQPQSHGLRYRNLRSAKAEEGVLCLLNFDASLCQETLERLKPEEFSSEYLGRVYGIFLQQWQESGDIHTNVLSEQLTPEEMSQLVRILQVPVSGENIRRALNDYINIIHTEKIRSSGGLDDETLLAFKKANGGKRADE